MSRYPTIPDFIATTESMATALRAVKDVLEIIAGQRQGESFGAPSVFVQEQEPALQFRPLLKEGDFWIKPERKRLHFWSGNEWVEVTAAP